MLVSHAIIREGVESRGCPVRTGIGSTMGSRAEPIHFGLLIMRIKIRIFGWDVVHVVWGILRVKQRFGCC